MIRITVDLLPSGDSEKASTIGIGYIWNDGSGTSESGNYNFQFGQHIPLWLKSGELKGFPRKKLGGLDLLYRCLKQILDGKGKEDE